MSQSPTLYDPETLKRVPANNHDAARRQRELDAALARINQENQVGQPGPPSKLPTAETVVVGSGKVIDPATALEPTVIEIPAPQPPAPEPAPTVPTISPEEYAKLQQSYREAQKALTPAFQKAAALHNELKEERESTKAEIKSLKDQLAELATMLKQSVKPAVPAYEPEFDDELNTLDPVVADRLRRFSQTTSRRMEELERKHQQEIQAIRDQERKNQEALAAHQDSVRQQTWEDVFTKLVPDFADYLSGTPKGKALGDWGDRMPVEYANAINNPRAHTPFFVAKVVNEFKSSQTPAQPPARVPASGDLAAKGLGNAPTRVEPPAQEQPLSTYEIQNAQQIMDRMMRDATNTKNSPEMRAQKLAEANAFMERFEKLAPQ
jgi:hypothetical protein